MARPTKYGIVVDRNATTTLNLSLKDAAGDPFDLTGYTPTADAVGDILPGGRLELSPTVTNASGGVITIVLAIADTGALVSTEGLKPSEIPRWDMLITAGGVAYKTTYGTFEVVETVTT